VAAVVGGDEVAFLHPEAFGYRADEEVADEAEEEQACHDVEDVRIGVDEGTIGGLVLVEVGVNDERPDDAGGAPGGEDTTVDGADIDAAEEVLEVGGNGRESATVHADEDAGDDDEEGQDVDGWKEEVEDSAKNEEDHVGRLATDEVGERGPDEAATHIEEREEADEASGSKDGDLTAEEVLEHGSGGLEDADASGDVEGKDEPEEPELRCRHGGVHGDIVFGDHGGLVDGRDEAFGLPAGGRDADRENAKHHEEEVNDSHPEEGGADGFETVGLEVSHEVGGERSADHGTSAEAHDGEAGGQAGTVGEPFDERGDGGDVADTEADAANASIAEIDKRQRVELDAKSGDEEAEAEAGGGDEHGLARASSLQPFAEDRCGDAEESDGEGEDVADLLVAPGGSDGVAEGEQRVDEDREGVDLADSKVNRQGSRWDKPAAVAGLGYGMITVKEGEQAHELPLTKG